MSWMACDKYSVATRRALIDVDKLILPMNEMHTALDSLRLSEEVDPSLLC